MKVIKRDGRAVEYDSDKIIVAIEKANKEVSEEKRATSEEIANITKYIETLDKKRILVEDIQDIIEQKLMEIKKYDLAKKYIVYRYTRALVRKQNTTDESILGLIKNTNGVFDNQNDVPVIASVQRNLIAGEVSKDLTKRILLPEKITKAHDDGVLHFHATDYFLQPVINSCVVNIGDMLDNGTVINEQLIEVPRSFQVACIVTTQIIAACASSQYGGQFVNIKHLGKYLRKSYIKIKNELKELNSLDNCGLSDEVIEKIARKRLKNELASGVQTIKYQINTLVTAYRRTPLLTLILELEENDDYLEENVMIIEEILRQNCNDINKKHLEITKEDDERKYEKLEYVFLKSDELAGEKYDELSNLAVKCGIKTTLPKRLLEDEKYKNEGSFNQGRVSINLHQIAKIAEGNEEIFWKLLDERLSICYEALMCRHYALLGTVSDVSPIHWQYGAIARLEPGEKIDRLLKDEYSTITLGYVGLEGLGRLLNGQEYSQKEEDVFEKKMLKYMEDTVARWKKIAGVEFVLSETRCKSVCERFEKTDLELCSN